MNTKLHLLCMSQYEIVQQVLYEVFQSCDLFKKKLIGEEKKRKQKREGHVRRSSSSFLIGMYCLWYIYIYVYVNCVYVCIVCKKNVPMCMCLYVCCVYKWFVIDSVI